MTQVDQVDLNNLESEFHRLQEEDKRLAGEVAYVLAVKAKRAREEEKCRYYAEKCVRIFHELNIQTLEGCRLGIKVDDVFLPGCIHEGVVKARFQELDIPF